MGVVVRRVNAAEETGKHVDRLLTQTPASADSEWLRKIAPEANDAAAEMKAVSEDSLYKKSQSRVVAAEVWARTLDDVKSGSPSERDQPNMLALISSELGDQYEKVMAKKREIAALKEQIANEEEARDKKGISDDEKKSHKEKIKELEKQADKLEDEVKPLQKDFLKNAKAMAAKAPADVRDKIGQALVNLRQAVDDAEVSNGAAAVRYPLALPGMLGAVQAQVPVIVADILEEQTGKRPSLDGLKPDVTLEGFTPNITLNGIGKEELGKISMGDLTKETVTRTTKWLGRVAGLLGYVAANKETLGFEADALDAILDGFASAGWKKPEPTKIPEWSSPQVKTATAKNRPRKSPAMVAAASTPKGVSVPKAADKKTQPAADATLKDDRAFATKPRAIGAVRSEIERLVGARDKADPAQRASILVKLADAYMELDYAATNTGDDAMASTAREQAIAAYEEVRAKFPSAVDAKLLLHLAIAYQRNGDMDAAKKVMSESQRRYPQAFAKAKAA